MAAILSLKLSEIGQFMIHATSGLQKIQTINVHIAQNVAFYNGHPNLMAVGLLQGEQVESGILDLSTSL